MPGSKDTELSPARKEPWLELLRRRPELIIGPALVAWILADCLPIAFGRPFILGVWANATFRHTPGNAFPVTYACAVLLFLFAVYTLDALSWPRRLLVAIAVPFAFTHLYEVPYELIAYWVWYPLYNWALWPLALFLNGVWLALGVSTFPFWKLDRRAQAVLALFLATFAVWWLWFWPFIPPIALPTNPEGSGYILSKVVLALLVACLLWAGRPSRGGCPVPERPSSVEDPPSVNRDAGPGVVAPLTAAFHSKHAPRLCQRVARPPAVSL
ncbi:MAG: hypothetical protein L3K11_02290 [Thermoplasmata archaeon]|nr:hypothetical protein [Thermoplasmata archaeon]